MDISRLQRASYSCCGDARVLVVSEYPGNVSFHVIPRELDPTAATATALLLPCHCLLLPATACHCLLLLATALLLPCYCPATALPLPCCCPATAIPLPLLPLLLIRICSRICSSYCSSCCSSCFARYRLACQRLSQPLLSQSPLPSSSFSPLPPPPALALVAAAPASAPAV